MKKINWNKFKTDALSTVKAFPVEIIFSICLFIVTSIQKENHSWYPDYIHNAFAFLPLFWVVSFTFNHLFSTPRLRWAYYSSLLFIVCAPFITVAKPLELPYAICWVIALAAIFACRRQKDNFRFSIDSLRFPYHVAISGILSLSLAGLLCGIYTSIIYIFDFESYHTGKVLFYLVVFPIIVVAPFLFCLFQNKEQDNYDWQADRFFEILNNWIVTPALLAYTALLYVYGLKILFTWDLPVGMLSYMISIYLFIAVIARACQKLLKKEYYTWFYSRFHLIAIPVLVLFWVGVLYRIQEYGFTEGRVYLFVLAILISVITIFAFNDPKTRYLYFIYLVIGLLASVTFIPPVNAKKIGVISQERRLNDLIKALDLKDAETGLIRNKDIPAALRDSSSQRPYEKMINIFSYLANKTSPTYMKQTYGYGSVKQLNKGLFAQNPPYYIEDADFKYYRRAEGQIVSIEEYTKLYDSYFYSQVRGDSVFIKTETTVVTAFDISNFLSDRPALLLKKTEENEVDSLLYLKNDSCMALISYLGLKNRKVESITIKTLLKK